MNVRFRVELLCGSGIQRRYEFVRPTRAAPYEMSTLDEAHKFVRTWYRDADTRIVAVRWASVNNADGFTRVFCTAGSGCCNHIVELSRRDLCGFWYWVPRLNYWVQGGNL